MPVSLGSPPQAGFDRPLDLLSDCHRRIERFLEVLRRVTEECNGGALDEEHRTALLTALEYFRSAAPKHTEDEESSLFPRLHQVPDLRVRPVFEILEQLEKDHDTTRRAHERVDRIARRWLSNGCLEPAAVSELDETLQRLRAMYEHHIRTEDEKIFPVARAVLSAHQVAEIGAEMRRRRGLDVDRTA